jgi:hypothetical protein
MRCQCPDVGAVPQNREYLYDKEERAGMNHKPNECNGTHNIKVYVRDGNDILTLCSCCHIKGRDVVAANIL